MILGSRLRQLRKERNLSLKDIAAYLDVTVSTISNYEKDVYTPDLTTLRILGDFYGVSIDYMMGRTDYYHSIDTLNCSISPNLTIEEFIKLVCSMSQQNIIALIDYTELLRLREGAI
jgi:transcriptional regulator with XRE-family HTH domain